MTVTGNESEKKEKKLFFPDQGSIPGKVDLHLD